MKKGNRCQQCGLLKSHRDHVFEHEFVPEERPGFGSQRQPIRARSEQMETYYRDTRRPAVRKAVGNGRRLCQIESPVCTGYVEGIHESAPRGRFGGLRAAVEAGPTFDSCNACNGYCSENPVWAAENGFLRSNKGEHRREPGLSKQARRQTQPGPRIKSMFK